MMTVNERFFHFLVAQILTQIVVIYQIGCIINLIYNTRIIHEFVTHNNKLFNNNNA
jgi:hypothetical protein